MKARIGLGVGSNRVRAVVVRRGTVAWHAEAEVSDPEALGRVIIALLRQAPRRGLLAPSVVVALGPGLSQTKQLADFPAVRDIGMVNRAVRQSVGRFFIVVGATAPTTVVHRAPSGAIWCAALETRVLRQVADACAALRLSFAGALPGAIAASRGLASGQFTWHDADIAVDVTAARGTPEMLRRRRAGEADAQPAAAPALLALGDDGWRYADAFGAALSTRSTPLFWHAADTSSAQPRRWQRPVLAACVGVAAVAVLFAGGLHGRLAARAARAQMDGTSGTVREMARVDQTLRTTTAAIDRIERFASDRRSITHLLSGLAQALPESTAILSLRADTVGGTIVTLSLRAADIVPQLREVSEIRASQIAGVATRETQANTVLERATIRFLFERRGASAASVRRP